MFRLAQDSLLVPYLHKRVKRKKKKKIMTKKSFLFNPYPANTKNAKNGGLIIPFKKFGMQRVKKRMIML